MSRNRTYPMKMTKQMKKTVTNETPVSAAELHLAAANTFAHAETVITTLQTRLDACTEATGPSRATTRCPLAVGRLLYKRACAKAREGSNLVKTISDDGGHIIRWTSGGGIRYHMKFKAATKLVSITIVSVQSPV